MSNDKTTHLDMPAVQLRDVQGPARIPELSLADIQRVSGGKGVGVDGFILTESANRPNGFILTE